MVQSFIRTSLGSDRYRLISSRKLESSGLEQLCFIPLKHQQFWEEEEKSFFQGRAFFLLSGDGSGEKLGLAISRTLSQFDGRLFDKKKRVSTLELGFVLAQSRFFTPSLGYSFLRL